MNIRYLIFVGILLSICNIVSSSSKKTSLKSLNSLKKDLKSKKLSINQNTEIMASTAKPITSVPSTTNSTPEKAGLPASIKLLIGAGGIYASFLYYGTLQEDVFHFKSAAGIKFTQAWFLQVLGV